MKDLIALLTTDLTKLSEDELIKSGRELETVLRHGFDLSARIMTALREKRPDYYSWSKLAEVMEVPQTTIWNRVHRP